MDNKSSRPVREKKQPAKLDDYYLDKNDENKNSALPDAQKRKTENPKQNKPKSISLKRKIQKSKPLALQNQNQQMLELKEKFVEKKNESLYFKKMKCDKQSVQNSLVATVTLPSDGSLMEIETAEQLVIAQASQKDAQKLLPEHITREIEKTVHVLGMNQSAELKEDSQNVPEMVSMACTSSCAAKKSETTAHIEKPENATVSRSYAENNTIETADQLVSAQVIQKDAQKLLPEHSTSEIGRTVDVLGMNQSAELKEDSQNVPEMVSMACTSSCAAKKSETTAHIEKPENASVSRSYAENNTIETADQLVSTQAIQKDAQQLLPEQSASEIGRTVGALGMNQSAELREGSQNVPVIVSISCTSSCDAEKGETTAQIDKPASTSYSEADFYDIEDRQDKNRKVYRVLKKYKDLAYESRTFKCVVTNLGIGFLTPEKVVANNITKQDRKNIEKVVRLVLNRTKKNNVPVLWIVRNGESMALVNKGRINRTATAPGSAETIDPAAEAGSAVTPGPADTTDSAAEAGPAVAAGPAKKTYLSTESGSQAAQYKARIDKFKKILDEKGVSGLTSSFKHFRSSQKRAKKKSGQNK